MKPNVREPKLFNIDLICDAQLLQLYVLLLSASSFNIVYIRFGKNVSLLYKSFDQYFYHVKFALNNEGDSSKFAIQATKIC